MLHVIYGDGRGKTTSAAGLALRAAGHGLPVLFIQFLKSDSSGEIRMLRQTKSITVCHAPVHYGFTRSMTEEQKKETAKACRELLLKAAESNAFLIVLDEVLHALSLGLISRSELEPVLEKDREIVLTGRTAPEWLVGRADYVTKTENLKHPLSKGIRAREGVEY